MAIRQLRIRIISGLALCGLVFWGGTVAASRARGQEQLADQPAPYKLQFGDEIQIQVMDLPSLTTTATIRPDGMISAMLLDDVKAADRTVSDVRHELTERYSTMYRNPRVGVFAKSFSNRTVYVTGEVGKPGSVTLASGMTVVQAVIQAGGFLPSSKLEEAVLLRQNGAAQRKVVALEIQKILKGEGTDIPLQPADVIYVPKSDIKVYVGGEVQRPGMVALDRQLTALKAITAAGGALDTGSVRGTVLMRDHGNGKPEIIHLRLDEVMRGNAEDALLQAYDILYVPRTNIAKIDKGIDQYIRRVIPMTLTGGFSYILGGGIGASSVPCFQ